MLCDRAVLFVASQMLRVVGYTEVRLGTFAARLLDETYTDSDFTPSGRSVVIWISCVAEY